VALAGSATPEELDAAVTEVRRQVEGRASFNDIAEVQQDLSADHPAWPMLTFKLARIHAHVRDLPKMQRALDSLLEQAPDSEFAPAARAMLTRMATPDRVVARRVGVFLPLSGSYQ